MLDQFETTAGTTAGTKHRRGVLENNQDHVVVHYTSRLRSLVISDGVGQSPGSYVASNRQAVWMTQLVHAHALAGGRFDDDIWTAFAEEMANRIRTNAGWSYLPLEKEIAHTWTATVGGIIMGPELTHLAAFGDPFFVLNGEVITCETANAALNQPAAVSYLVVPSTLPASELRFKVITVPTSTVENAVVATDGLKYLQRAIGRTYPGTDEVIPDLSYLWTCDELFKPNGMDNWLNYLARDWQKRGNVLSGGRLTDDLAVAVARHRTTEV